MNDAETVSVQLKQFQFTSNMHQGPEPEVSVFHFEVQFALVMVETSKFCVKVLDELINALQQTITIIRQSAQKNEMLSISAQNSAS